MKQDKEQFRSKNRDESYIKDKRPDVQLGRHTDILKSKSITQSKKNRMYQAQQEPQTETAVVNPDWVEWLMGFPQKWTDENCSSGSLSVFPV